MAWFITDDLAEYQVAAGEFLASRPVEHTVPLTVAQTLRLRGAAAFGRERPLFGWWRARDGAVTSAFLHTPPHPVLLTSVPPDVIAPLTETLVAAEHTVAGVNADAAAAEEFAAEWRRLTGASWRLEQRHRLYRLGELIPPSPAPAGAARVAGRADRDLLLAWYEAFVQEAGQGPGIWRRRSTTGSTSVASPSGRSPGSPSRWPGRAAGWPVPRGSHPSTRRPSAGAGASAAP